MRLKRTAQEMLVILCINLAVFAVQSSQAEEQNRYIVQYLPLTNTPSDSQKPARRNRIKALGGEIKLEIPNRRAYAAMLSESAVRELRASPEVALVEIDPPRFPMSDQVPQGVIDIKADQVDYAGDPGIKVCVIDSGFDLGHPDLPSGLRVTGSTSVAGDWNLDASGHGTHVAGTIMAMQNNLGVVGIVPTGQFDVHIHRVFNDEGDSTPSSEVVVGLDQCVAEGAKVVNLSLGCSGQGCFSSFENQAFADALSAGVLSVAAAGNDGDATPSYPAAYPSVLAVAAVDQNQDVASFSQHYPQVELAAPGVSVISTLPRGTGFGATLVVGALNIESSPLVGSANGDFTGALVDCGLGEITCVGVEDAVCFIQRGTFLFAEKTQSCEQGGGKAVVIYNNVAGQFSGTLGELVTQLPVVGISDTDGALLQGFVGTQTQVVVGSTDYGRNSGTSMSTPHVAGAAALLWGYNPAWSANQIRDALIAGAVDLGTPGRDPFYGYGMINVLASLNSLFGDEDSDGDGLPDNYELEHGFNAFDPQDGSEDADGDSLSNLVEFQQNTDPNNPNDPILLAKSSRALEKRIYFANPASNITQQTFLRFINTSASLNSVEVRGIDDAGQDAPLGVLRFDLAPQASLQLNAQDLELGNASKGTSGQLGNGTGKWQLSIGSSTELETMSLIRTPDGFLTSLTDTVPQTNGVYEVSFANPGSNPNQQSFLRIVNTSAQPGMVTLSGVDDNGLPAPGGDISFMLAGNESKNFNSSDYELGNPAKNITGSLGDGSGKWRLTVSSDAALAVMSLIRSPDGFLTNLSAVVDKDANDVHQIYFANPASVTAQQSFLRFINQSNTVGELTLSAIDDAGVPAPSGDIVLTLGALNAVQLNAVDLENGNADKGLPIGLGNGSERWRISVASELDLRVMNLIRTPDGFVTNMSRLAGGGTDLERDAFIFNPASNQNQRSFLRITNRSLVDGLVEIQGVDDSGVPAVSGPITFNLPAGATIETFSADLEQGNPGAGLNGNLGDGTGKWRLSISANVELEVMSLLNTPTGFLTNLSRTTE